MHSRLYQIQEIASEYEQDRSSIASLKDNPRDPLANLAAGRFYAFYLGDWARGVPMLANGADPVLKEPAKRDAKSVASAKPEDVMTAADAWADAAKPMALGTVRDAIQRRALSLYDNAGTQLTGLTRAAVKKREDDLRNSRLIHGLTCEYFRGEEMSSRVFVRTDPHLDFNWAGQAPEPLLCAEGFSARWTGYIRTAPGEYDLIAVHDDGMRISLDGQQVIDVWKKSGRHGVKCVFTGALQTIEISYRQIGGNSYAGLGWKLPGARVAKLVPDTAFMHDPPAPGPVYSPLPRGDATGTIRLEPGARGHSRALCPGQGY